MKISLMREIEKEHQHQIKKWGDKHDAQHSPEDFILIIETYMNKAARDGDYRRRFIQISALAASAVESMDSK